MISSSRKESDVAQFVVRNLEDDVAEKLKKRARSSRFSSTCELWRAP